MKTALSIRQPWAWLIAAGHKDIENRDWPTPFRGEFLVHAGKTVPSESEIEEIEREFGVRIPRSELLYGGIVGVATITGCVSESDSPWFFGEYGFTLANARPLPFLPLRGKLGFFPVLLDVPGLLPNQG